MKTRKPLARKTPLPRSPMKRGKRKSAYKRRERDTSYMLFVKKLPCAVEQILYFDSPRTVVALCTGRVQADHAGCRGLGQKADDRTCIPMCEKHHNARTDFAGAFKGWTQREMRDFLAEAIKRTQQAYEDVRAIRSYR